VHVLLMLLLLAHPLGLGLSQLSLLESVPGSGTKFTRNCTAGDAERKEWVERRGKKRARREILMVQKGKEGKMTE
jgi:hypothetical protein